MWTHAEPQTCAVNFLITRVCSALVWSGVRAKELERDSPARWGRVGQGGHQERVRCSRVWGSEEGVEKEERDSCKANESKLSIQQRCNDYIVELCAVENRQRSTEECEERGEEVGGSLKSFRANYKTLSRQAK